MLMGKNFLGKNQCEKSYFLEKIPQVGNQTAKITDP